MSKHFRFLVLALMLVGLTAGSAFAGTMYVSHGANNTPFTAALEALGTGAARNIVIQGIATGAPNGQNLGISYVLGQNVSTGNLVTISFTGAAYDGSALGICAGNTGAAGNAFTQIATATPTAGTTSWNFQVNLAGAVANAEVAAGGNMFMALAGACNAAGAKNTPLRLTAEASAGMATVSFAINTAGNVPVDPAAAAGNLALIALEYTAANNAASNQTIDYLGTPGNGTQLLYNGVAAGNTFAWSGAVNVTKANYNLNAVNSAAGAINAGLTAGLVLTAQDTANWQGVSKVFISGGTAAQNVNCNDVAGGNIIGTTAAPNGTLTFTVPAAAFNSSGANNYDLCVAVNGTSVLNTRTISVGSQITITGTNANSPAASGLAVMDTWGLNALQVMIPWVVNASTLPTYCHIANADGAKNASVILDVMSSETGATLTSLNLGTISPKTSKLVTFTGNSVSMAGGLNADLTTLGVNTRHSDRLTVTIAPANGTVSCIQTDPVTGGKRNVLNTPG